MTPRDPVADLGAPNRRDNATGASLTEPQRRHLSEMIGADGKTFYWHPKNQGERACANALKAKGLLAGDATTYSSAYWLTEAGLQLACGLKKADRG